jgi:hypothetical protein
MVDLAVRRADGATLRKTKMETVWAWNTPRPAHVTYIPGQEKAE